MSIMNTQIATVNDYIQIRELWTLIFPEDSKEYLDFYFDTVMHRNTVLIIKAEESIIGMLHLNPYCVNGLEDGIYYIVGVATHPDHRRKGIMRKMLDFAKGYAYEEGKNLLLLPEDERYYKPFGYEFVSMQYNTTIKSNEYKSMINDEKVVANICNQEDFINWFADHNYNEKHLEAIHSESYLKSLYKELTCEGGRISNIDGHLVLYYLEDVLEIRKIYYSDINSLENLISELLCIAENKDIVIHEVNERIISKCFSYSRKNNYDYRPYMMKLMKNNESMSVYFDEVV